MNVFEVLCCLSFLNGCIMPNLLVMQSKLRLFCCFFLVNFPLGGIIHFTGVSVVRLELFMKLLISLLFLTIIYKKNIFHKSSKGIEV